MANENPTWGYTRIRGGLKSLGHEVARNTIKAILKDHGIAPAPERGTKTPWKTFLAAHWDALAAADFFTVEVLTVGGLVRYVVFFVMKLKTRAVEIAGITCQPDESWMTQLARNLTDAGDGFLRGVQYLILDRDPLYTAAFRRLLRDSGVKPLLLPARSPNLNAFAERFVLSVKSECLDRIVPLGEAHLRAAVRAFVDHYHEERPHQGSGQRAHRAQDHVDAEQARSSAVSGSAACSSSTTARPRSRSESRPVRRSESRPPGGRFILRGSAATTRQLTPPFGSLGQREPALAGERPQRPAELHASTWATVVSTDHRGGSRPRRLRMR